MIRRSTFRFLLAATAVAAHVVPTVAPDAQRKEPLLSGRDAAAVVTLSVGSGLATRADAAVADWFRAPARQRSTPLRVVAHGANLVAIPLMPLAAMGMWAGGRLGGDRNTAVLGLRMSEAIVGATLVTAVGKVTVGRARPVVSHDSSRSVGWLRGLQGDRWSAFPSGHTSIAFATATVLHRQLGAWYPDRRAAVGVASYAVASLAGLARMHDDRHWLSDVLAGAAIGTLAGALVVRGHERTPGSAVDRWFLGASLSTAGDGLSLAWSALP